MHVVERREQLVEVTADGIWRGRLGRPRRGGRGCGRIGLQWGGGRTGAATGGQPEQQEEGEAIDGPFASDTRSVPIPFGGPVAARPLGGYHAGSQSALDPFGAARCVIPTPPEELDTLMDLELTLDAREAHGKANKRLRRAGLVPGVVFGKGEESTPVQIDAKVFETLYRQAGRTSVVNMHLPGKSGITSGIIKSVQRNPLSGSAIHVDFFLVNLKQEMELDVPIVFTGEAPAVEETGGTLLHNLSSLHVKALPNDIPQQVVVDVSVLRTLDVAIHVRDLSLNRDLVHVLTDGDTLVATVVPPRIEEEPEVVLTEEELEAAAAAEGEEGEGAPAEGGEVLRPRASAAPRTPPSPDRRLLADELLHLGADRLDVGLQDVAPAVAPVPLEHDQRRLNHQL